MSLSQKIASDLKTAMKAKEPLRVSCLRMLKTAIKNKQVEQGRELKDDEIEGVISSLIRKRQEAAEEFNKGNRQDLADKEEKEIRVLYAYLPEQLSPAQIEEILRKIIDEQGASGPQDIGKVMKAGMPRMAGKAQGKEVNEIARRLLSSSA
jgi:hypothetical protein